MGSFWSVRGGGKKKRKKKGGKETGSDQPAVRFREAVVTRKEGGGLIRLASVEKGGEGNTMMFVNSGGRVTSSKRKKK